jgi:hypothetical protein
MGRLALLPLWLDDPLVGDLLSIRILGSASADCCQVNARRTQGGMAESCLDHAHPRALLFHEVSPRVAQLVDPWGAQVALT